MSLSLVVTGDGLLRAGDARYRCAIGKAGLTADKREGDHATPIGEFALRRLYYRADRFAMPKTGLPCAVLTESDGWCDDPADPHYNRFVALPHAGRCERLWRDDALYDCLVVIGHNDDPVVAGRGSAIFLHVATSDYAGTEGCVALAAADLRRVLAGLDGASRIRIKA